MPRYRYQTPALTGPWRESEAEALADAVRANQLRIAGEDRQWLVPGHIEESAAPAPRKRY